MLDKPGAVSLQRLVQQDDCKTRRVYTGRRVANTSCFNAQEYELSRMLAYAERSYVSPAVMSARSLQTKCRLDLVTGSVVVVVAIVALIGWCKNNGDV